MASRQPPAGLPYKDDKFKTLLSSSPSPGSRSSWRAGSHQPDCHTKTTNLKHCWVPHHHPVVAAHGQQAAPSRTATQRRQFANGSLCSWLKMSLIAIPVHARIHDQLLMSPPIRLAGLDKDDIANGIRQEASVATLQSWSQLFFSWSWSLGKTFRLAPSPTALFEINTVSM